MVSTNQVVRILRKNGIHINDDEAIVILDFLYMLVTPFKKEDDLVL
jgi:hypothetical protein